MTWKCSLSNLQSLSDEASACRSNTAFSLWFERSHETEDKLKFVGHGLGNSRLTFVQQLQ